MRKLAIILSASIAFALPGCVTSPELPPPEEGGPPRAERCDDLGTTDSKAICTTFAAFDLALDGVALLRESGVLRPGTPKAVEVATIIEEVDALLADASAIQRGIRSGDLNGTLDRATAAIGRLRAALRR